MPFVDQFAVPATNPYISKAIELADIFAQDAAERDRVGGAPHQQIQWIKESGLLKLPILKKYGGEEQPWSVILRVVREFAKADTSIAHLYGFHCLNVIGTIWKCSPEQIASLQGETARNDWFWGNSINYLDRRLTGKKEGSHYVLNGLKGFSSGSPVADYLSVSWRDEEKDELVFGCVPVTKTGLTVHDDWDGIGQRQTGSGTVQFENVIVYEDEISGSDRFADTAYATLIPILSKSVMTNLFIGSIEGAIKEAREYTLRHTRPFIASGVAKATEDPWIQRQYGELWLQLLAAAALGDTALAKVDEVWEKGEALTTEERGEAAVLVGAANVFAGNAALEVTSRIFEVMGARSATISHGFDRFWRNVRTHTLHDPVEYKLRSVGSWLLTGSVPSSVYG
ncbi:monooxygenase [Paenibacillus sp. FSL H8-0548]|uniref:acyl-CoA dehydrogenase family protein n=1 Tax=Paenibacillus sp. FSL H8-0548 TaxID=1920422 RepID=UPI00096D4700|nr:acyl-CoA dehydrogenase family protein [Paenibacillus sp. FSL H8-0548]OMF20299.1 monooxygenase [Paenibacillus sp. FSL H8-0548]